MRFATSSFAWLVLAALALDVALCVDVHAQGQFKVLHNFGEGTGGAGLWS